MRRCFSLIFLSFLILSNWSIGQRDYRYKSIERIKGNSLILSASNYSVYYNNDSVNISDLIVIDSLLSKEEVKQLYPFDTDFRILILKLGYAKLKDTTKAKKEEIDAQRTARNSKKGLWSEEPESVKQNPEVTNSESRNGILLTVLEKINDFFVYLWENKGTILGFFGATLIFAWMKKLYFEKRFKLLLLGDAAAGKSALKKVIVDPNTTEETIRKLSPTDETTIEEKKSDIIRIGRFVILPKLTDIPGKRPQTIFENLFRIKNEVLVFVVAPIKDDGREGLKEDHRYIDDQYTYIRLIMGAVIAFTKKVKRKPKIIILFINKFDLYSSKDPDNSAEQKQKIELLFEPHITKIKSEARELNVAYDTLIGSSLKQWNTVKLLKLITDELYKGLK